MPGDHRSGIYQNDLEARMPRVLMFHNAYPIVSRSDVFHSWNTTTAKIKSVLEFLARDYDFIDEDYLHRNWGEPDAFRNKILISFDDGYKNVHIELRKILHNMRIKPILFLVSDVVKHGTLLWYQKLALAIRYTSTQIVTYETTPFNLRTARGRIGLYNKLQAVLLSANAKDEFDAKLKYALGLLSSENHVFESDPDMLFLSSNEIQDLISDGWSIGAHGKTHTPLSCLSAEEAESELKASKETLRKLLKTKIRSVSYPNGGITDSVIQIASRFFTFGFLASRTTTTFSPLRIPRFDFPSDEVHIRTPVVTRSTGTERSILSPAINEPAEIDPSGRIMPLSFCDLSKQQVTRAKKRLVVLCGPNHPERYAVAKLSTKANLVGLVVHNYRQTPISVFRGSPQKQDFQSFERNIRYENLSAMALFGATALPFIVPKCCACVQTLEVNHRSVEPFVLGLKPEVIVVFGTGLIKAKNILQLSVPKINLHWGRSPNYRGSYTLRWPILNKDPAGLAVTVHELDPGIDSGPVYEQRAIELDGSESMIEVEYKASLVGVEIILDLLDQLEAGIPISGTRQEISRGKLYYVRDWRAVYDEVVENVLAAGFALKAKQGRLRSPESAFDEEAKLLNTIRNSYFFDEDYYLSSNRDVSAAGIDPALHYLVHGGFEGRDPGPAFSTCAYLESNPDVAAARMNPLIHYELHGRSEGRLPGAYR